MRRLPQPIDAMRISQHASRTFPCHSVGPCQMWHKHAIVYTLYMRHGIKPKH